MSWKSLSGNEGAKNKQGKHNIFRKKIIADIDLLLQLYMAIICSVCINTLQIANEKA